MNHPFSRFEPPARRALAVVLSALALACFVAIAAVDVKLRTDEVPLGIVQYELARDPLAATAILRSWGALPGPSLYAAFSLGLDFLFLSLYGPLLALACASVADRFGERARGARTVGVLLAWAQLLAAAFDGVENVALFRMLLRESTETLAPLAFYFASAKFGLLGAGIAYLLAGFPLSRRVAAR